MMTQKEFASLGGKASGKLRTPAQIAARRENIKKAIKGQTKESAQKRLRTMGLKSKS